MQEVHPHIALARRLWAATAEGDEGAVRALLAANVTWRSSGQNPLSGEYEGPDEVLDYLARVGESTDELRMDLTDVFVNPCGAVVVYHATARRELRRLEMDYILVLRIEDGKVVRALSVPVDQQANDAFWS